MELVVKLGLQRCWCSRKTRRTPEKTVFIAEVTCFEAKLVIYKQFPATITLVAQNEPVRGARAALGGVHLRKIFQNLLELADLVQLSQLLDPANVLASDEYAWQVQLGPAQAHDLV